MKITKEQLKAIIKESVQDYIDAYYPETSYRDVLVGFCRDAHKALYGEDLPEEDILTTSTYDLKKMADDYEKALEDSNLLKEGDVAKKIKTFYPDDYSEHDALFSYYSDIFKELNGFRPHPTRKPSLEELEDMVKNVELSLEREMTEKQEQETIFDKLPTKIFDDIVEELQSEQKRIGKLSSIEMTEIIQKNYPQFNHATAREITEYILVNKIGGLYEDIIAGGTGGLSPISGGPVLAEEDQDFGEYERGYAAGTLEASTILKSLSEKVEDDKIAKMLMNLSRNLEGMSVKAKAKSFEKRNTTKKF